MAECMVNSEFTYILVFGMNSDLFRIDLSEVTKMEIHNAILEILKKVLKAVRLLIV